MINVYLARHAQAASSWHESRDPGLSDLGRDQARTLANDVARFDGPLPVISSPLQRARETAAPLAHRWETEPVIEPRIAEIPSPGLSLEERGPWLLRLFECRWPELDPHLHDWRAEALDAIRACRGDTVLVSHAVLINAVVGALTGDDRVLVFRPDYCSVTHIEVLPDGTMKLAEKGLEARTRIR